MGGDELAFPVPTARGGYSRSIREDPNIDFGYGFRQLACGRRQLGLWISPAGIIDFANWNVDLGLEPVPSGLKSINYRL